MFRSEYLRCCTANSTVRFSSLFLSYIEETLGPSKNKLVQNLFCGNLENSIQCCTCKTVSKIESNFYELVLHVQVRSLFTTSNVLRARRPWRTAYNTFSRKKRSLRETAIPVLLAPGLRRPNAKHLCAVYLQYVISERNNPHNRPLTFNCFDLFTT